MSRLRFNTCEKDFVCSGGHKNVNFLPCKILITLYQSLVESRLRYCNTVWGNCGLTLKNKLQSLQNRAARVVTRTKYGCVEPDQLLKNLRWLNVQQLIDFDTAVMVHKSINNKAPRYLKSLFQNPTQFTTTIPGLQILIISQPTRDLNLGKNAFPTMDVIYGTSWTGMF